MAAPQKRSHQEQAGEGTAEIVPTKRNRTAHACDSCRVRKSRCDGARPTCDICAAIGLLCRYRAPARPSLPAVRDDNSARIESRLQAIEALLHTKTQQSKCNSNPAHCLATPDDDPDLHPAPNVQGLVTAADQPLLVNTSNVAKNGVPGGRSNDDNVDGLALITVREEDCSVHFGPTSNSAFFNSIMAAARDLTESLWSAPRPSEQLNSFANDPASRSATPPPAPVSLSGDTITAITAAVTAAATAAIAAATSNAPPPPLKFDVAALSQPHFILPPSQEIQDYVEIFFSSTASLFPYLYKPTILLYLDAIKASRVRSLQGSQLCILNMIMALACVCGNLSNPVEDRIRKGNEFFNKALQLLPNWMTSSGSLETIQSLLLIVQYLQGTQRSTQTGIFLGAAVNVALQMGMQISSLPEHLGVVEKEIFRRTWWMCNIMDSMGSMTLGRPPLIRNEHMKIPLPQDIDLATFTQSDDEAGGADEAHSTSGQTSKAVLFVQISKLNLVLGDIIETVYHQNLSVDKEDSVSQLLKSIMDCEKDLLGWTESLPADRKLFSGTDIEALSNATSDQRPRVILTLRYQNTRALLHRQVISRLLAVEPISSTKPRVTDLELRLLQRFSNNSIEISLESAIESIQVLSCTVSRPELLTPWWISIYLAFSSALILFGALVALKRHEMHCSTYPASQLVKHLHVASKVLEELGNGTRLFVRASKIIRKIMKIASIVAAPSTVQAQAVGSSEDILDATTMNHYQRQTGAGIVGRLTSRTGSATAENVESHGDADSGMDVDAEMEIRNPQQRAAPLAYAMSAGGMEVSGRSSSQQQQQEQLQLQQSAAVLYSGTNGSTSTALTDLSSFDFDDAFDLSWLASYTLDPFLSHNIYD